MSRGFCVLVLAVGFLLAGPAWAETVELVTYYPAPGQGGDLHVNTLTVGADPAYSGTTPPDGTAIISDRLGIGTNNPQGPLHVVGVDGAQSNALFLPGAGGTLNVGIGTNNPQGPLHVVGVPDAVSNVIFSAGVDNAGVAGVPEIRVGIGTAAPQAPLQVGANSLFVQNDQGGNIELGGNGTIANPVVGGMPYIDFHFGLNPATAQDFNTRIINTADNRLSIFTSADLVNPTMTINGPRVGIGIEAPAASALLELSSTTRGLLPPRMTTAQRNAIASPAQGLMIYNTTTNQLNTYDGEAWTTAAGGASVFAANGYSQLPGGLIIQWGIAGVANWDGMCRRTISRWLFRPLVYK